jgi:Big-like domain-containing protein
MTLKNFNLCGILTVAMGLIYSAQGQISVLSSGAGPLIFDTRPTVAEGWSTTSVGDNAANITTVAQFQTAVQLLNAANITTQVGTSGSDNPFNPDPLARHNTLRFRLQSKPTGVDFTVLMATLRNDTLSDVTSFDVSYLHAVDPAGAETPTPALNGWYGYYSTTGAPGSWQPIPAFTGVNANASLTATISAHWSPGLNFYIIWADDNGGGTEGGYTLDDFTISNVITETLPVSIAITSPTNTQQIVQGVTVNVTTTSSGPIQTVDFRVDGGSVSVDSTPPFGFPLDTTPLAIGGHSIQAFASDGSTETPSAIVNFQIIADQPPIIVITNLVAPTNFLVGTAIPVNGNIRDDVTVTNVDWFIDGNFYVSRAGVANLGFTYVDPLVGSHTIYGVASDTKGQQTTSASVTVGVTNPVAAIFGLLLTNGSTWKYFNSTFEPTDNGFASWYQDFFDDNLWASGPAEIGGGDRADGHPETTTIDIGPNPGRFMSIYFRNTFTVDNPAEFPNVILRLLRDDGAVVYLNQVPVWTNNMATTDLDPVTGNIAYTNRANASDDGLAYQTFNVSSDLLRSGPNLIAVEVHQQNDTSSDISFDMMIWGERATTPVLTITSPTNGQTFISGVLVTNNVTASTFVTNVTLLVDGVAVGSDDTRPFSIVASNLAVGTRTLRARGRDQFGVTGDSPLVTITIIQNQLPTVTLTNPPGNLQMLVGGSITLGAQAADADGTITRVEFHDNGVLVATPDTTVAYSRDDVDLTAGVHTFTAVAFDNSGASTVSAPITVTVTNPPNATALLTNRSEWKWVAVTNGDFGTTWVNLGYSDSSWNIGRGKFGFGGDGEQTVVGVTNIPSFYFRKVINIPDPSALGQIIIAAIRDDGIAVHVNSSAVWIDRMTGATPPIPFDTLADSPAVGGADENTYFFSTNANSIFVPGQNIIAVEIHQQSLTSSDIGFDMMIFSAAPGCPNPSISHGPGAGQLTISWSGSGQLYSSTVVDGPYTTLASPTSPYIFTPSGSSPRFFVVRCN